MTRSDKTHYTVPDRVAYDIVDNPPPPGMEVNCFSCWGVQRKGLPDRHTIAWSPLDRIPASAKARAVAMIMAPVPGKPAPRPFLCTCDAADKAQIGDHHHQSCEYYCPF